MQCNVAYAYLIGLGVDRDKLDAELVAKAGDDDWLSRALAEAPDEEEG
jgi:hypothetical protein